MSKDDAEGGKKVDICMPSVAPNPTIGCENSRVMLASGGHGSKFSAWSRFDDGIWLPMPVRSMCILDDSTPGCRLSNGNSNALVLGR